MTVRGALGFLVYGFFQEYTTSTTYKLFSGDCLNPSELSTTTKGTVLHPEGREQHESYNMTHTLCGIDYKWTCMKNQLIDM